MPANAHMSKKFTRLCNNTKKKFNSMCKHIRINFLLVCIGAIYYFNVWLFWKNLIGYVVNYLRVRLRDQTSSKYAHSVLLNLISHVMSQMVSMLSNSRAIRLN